MQKDNHYVSQGYLKRFCDERKQLFVFRTLVPDKRMPLWKLATPRGVAKQEHLFTRFIGGRESDELERWMCSEFESPAEAALQRAVTDNSLSKDDWHNLIRFFALHAVRTPRRLHQRFVEWQMELPRLIDETLQRVTAKLERMVSSGEKPVTRSIPYVEEFPCRIVTQLRPGDEMGSLYAEVLSGRAMWQWELRRLLTSTLALLLKHRWTILVAPDETTWFTSDAPCVQLNWYGVGKQPEYDFGGGWGRTGTDLFMPLSPKHLLHTTVGRRPDRRGTIVSAEFARRLRQCMAEHADRMIFASTHDDEVPRLRPRVADKQGYDFESEQWRNWNRDQSKAEIEFFEKIKLEQENRLHRAE